MLLSKFNAIATHQNPLQHIPLAERHASCFVNHILQCEHPFSPAQHAGMSLMLVGEFFEIYLDSHAHETVSPNKPSLHPADDAPHHEHRHIISHF